MHLTKLTDNSGNTSALARLMSSKFPLVVVMTEVAAQLQEKQMELDLEWIPRNQNEEADGLTNGDFGPFDPALRIQVEISKLDFIILPKMVAAADDLYEKVRINRTAARSATGTPPPQPPSRTRPLRERDPWQ